MGLKDGRVILGPTKRNSKDRKKALDNECLTQMIKKELENKITLKADSSNEGLQEDLNFECFTCGEGFETEEGISLHNCSQAVNMQEDEGEEDESKDSDKGKKRFPGKSNVEGPAQCEVCGKEYKTHKRLKDHLSFCHPQVT